MEGYQTSVESLLQQGILQVFRVHITKRVFGLKNPRNLSCGIRTAEVCIGTLHHYCELIVFFIPVNLCY